MTNKISAEARRLILDDLILTGNITGGQYVHPIFRRSYYDSDNDERIDLTVQYIEAINKGLSDAGLAYKPDIVLEDVLSNGIKIVDANGALVYEDGIPADGISWERICDWHKNEAVGETEEKQAKRFTNV